MSGKTLLFVVIFATQCIWGANTEHDKIPERFVVDLDLDPIQRWNHVVPKYKAFTKHVREILSYVIPKEALPLAEEIARDLDNYLPDEYAQEMKGIAKAMNMSLGDVVILNLSYDIEAYCTSIVCQDSNGTIWHARNLDAAVGYWGRYITIQVDFQKQGKTVFTAVTFAAYVGVLTGQRPQNFTVSLNQRNKGQWWMNLLMAILDRSAKPMGFLLRDVLSTSPTFSHAVDTLSNTDTFTDAYFILGGVKAGDGVIITKSRIGSDDLWYLNEASPSWFLVETNYDHWNPAPAGDDRRDPAIKTMTAMGQNHVSVTQLYDVISTHPVLNNDTIFSVVMSASQPALLKSWVRYP